MKKENNDHRKLDIELWKWNIIMREELRGWISSKLAGSVIQTEIFVIKHW